jgi:hypothetical protein
MRVDSRARCDRKGGFKQRHVEPETDDGLRSVAVFDLIWR